MSDPSGYPLALLILEAAIFAGALAAMSMGVRLWAMLRGAQARAWQIIILGFLAFFTAEAARLSEMLGWDIHLAAELSELMASALLVAGLAVARAGARRDSPGAGRD